MVVKQDQAASLRSTVNGTPGTGSAKVNRNIMCLAVASGKGGVGKTFVAVNLAVSFQKLNKKVLLVDADLGLANADIVLGVNPEFTLQDALFEGKSLAEVVVKTPYGVDLLAASSGSREMVSLGSARLGLFIEELLQFAANYDVLIFDCSAGIDNHVTAFLAAAPQSVVVTTTQPTSLVDVYALIKVIHQENLGHSLGVVFNMVESEAHAERAMFKLRQVSQSYLNLNVKMLGWIPQSAAALRAVNARRPLVASEPDDPASGRVLQVARALLQKQNGSMPLKDMNWSGMLDRLLRKDKSA